MTLPPSNYGRGLGDAIGIDLIVEFGIGDDIGMGIADPIGRGAIVFTTGSAADPAPSLAPLAIACRRQTYRPAPFPNGVCPLR